MATMPVHTCILRLLAISTKCKDKRSLVDDVAPAILSLSWEGSANLPLVPEAIQTLTQWPDLGLADLAAKVALKMVRSGRARENSAYSVAKMITGSSVMDTAIGKEHAELSSKLGIPLDPTCHGPRSFISLCKRKKIDNSVMERYLSSASSIVALQSKGSSLQSMAAALRAWGKYCDLTNSEHFPVTPEKASRFSAVCREPGTFAQYLSHVRAACELLGWPADWFHSPPVNRAKEGLKRSMYVFKGPKSAVTSQMIARLATRKECREEAFFCFLSWVFLLRSRSEASTLVMNASEDTLRNRHQQLVVPGVIGILDQKLVIRLRSRKNRLGGDTISRDCVCKKKTGVNIHVPVCLCPIHFLWEWIKSRGVPGKPLFSEGVAGRSQAWLQVALEARGYPESSSYTLHALRRGGAQSIMDEGGDLATILKAGGWKSSAFRVYLDMMGLENAVVTASLGALLDMDAEA